MSKLAKALDEYRALQQEVFAYFGYVDGWRAIPIEDRREMFWHLSGEGAGDEVIYSPDAHWSAENTLYVDEVYTNRFLSKWVYRGADYTMICVDTHTDGNKFLAIYENAKERKPR